MHSSIDAEHRGDSGVSHSGAIDDTHLEEKKAVWTQEQFSLAQQADVPQRELHGLTDASQRGEDDCDNNFVHTRFSLAGVEAALDSMGSAEGSRHWSALRRQLAWDVSQQARGSAADVDCGLSCAVSPQPPALTLVGGVDISFIPGTDDGIACLAILRYPSLEVVKTYMHRCTLREPYISTFLAFREIQPVCELFNAIKAELAATETMPQLLVVDGNGVHHPRRCGLATHLGVLLNIPTIGCSKTILQMDGISRDGVEEALTCEAAAATATAKAGTSTLPDVLPLVGASSPFPLYGYAVRGQRNSVKKCIFASPGHGVGFAVATALIATMLRHRIPEPIRAADLGSRAFIRDSLVSGTKESGA